MKKLLFLILLIPCVAFAQRDTVLLLKNWQFKQGEQSGAEKESYDSRSWRTVDLPHDWSIEGSFRKEAPETINQAALPTGIGWYRKSFSWKKDGREVLLHFDGVYRNSEVWVNGNFLGKRPIGYISFSYNITRYLKGGQNLISVRVDNSAQPSSRWYTGSGIYRKVWLEFQSTDLLSNIQLTTPDGNRLLTFLNFEAKAYSIKQTLYNASGSVVTTGSFQNQDSIDLQPTSVRKWSPTDPNLYKVVTSLYLRGKLVDRVSHKIGFRSFKFTTDSGLVLNGKQTQILGVCQHSDYGALGVASYRSAIERQLMMLKKMGCNGIRTAHNPPPVELLEACDSLGFIVMDEAFDMWAKRKNKQDYHIEFNEWSKRDLADQVLRDRNHTSVFIWSIGNEIREQFDSSGTRIAQELASVVKTLDKTRPVTSALTETHPEKNFIWKSGALDLLGFNYKLYDYDSLRIRFPNSPLIAAETMSALGSRGYYEMPSTVNKLWPADSKTPYVKGNPGHEVSSYDHVYAYWGSTHEDGWKAVRDRSNMAGLYVWSGYDFLGEPVPYNWPSRSSYYGIIDLAGFPKDVYYMYQSEWTDKPVLHVFPHWNWIPGQLVDVWAYYSRADAVELFLNGKSLGRREKSADTLHVKWSVPFEPGELKAVSYKNNMTVLSKTIRTAGRPSRLQLRIDPVQPAAKADQPLFVQVAVVDKEGNDVPDAALPIRFGLQGEGSILAVDNGNAAGLEPFKNTSIHTYHGKCTVVIKPSAKNTVLRVSASSPGCPMEYLTITVK